MNKYNLIEAYLTTPVQPGEQIWITKNNRRRLVDVISVTPSHINWKDHDEHGSVKIEDATRYTRHIGANPFQEPFIMRQLSIDLWTLLFRMGWKDNHLGEFEPRHEKILDMQIPEVNFDSTVAGPNGEDVVYQRGLVWSTQDKQNLIESIYNHIEIGKFVLRNRSWAWVERRIKNDNIKRTAFNDVVDGKQRAIALIEFVTNKFPDLHGNYWRDLSDQAQSTFQRYNKFSFFELDADATDAEVLRSFLAINFTGVPMSQEHIKYVKSINLLNNG